MKTRSQLGIAPFYSRTIDQLLLIIDNNKYALAHIMQLVRQNPDQQALANALNGYCRTRLLTLLQDTRFGSVEEHAEAERAVINTNFFNRKKTVRQHKPEYWLAVAAHYMQKHAEGVDMQWALTGLSCLN